MKYLTILPILLFQLSLDGAVQVQDKALPKGNVFGLRFSGAGGEFIGRVDLIGSISLQKYVTSTFQIAEMCIDIAGSDVQLRVYHQGPLKSSTILPGNRNAVTNPLDRINPKYTSKLNQLVYKEYPVTTHAKTLEFKVGSEADLIDLHAQLRNRWIGAGGKGLGQVLFTVP